MSKAVLISIQPKWCNLIVNGEKTVEVRKTRPNLETPFKAYIYCTKSKSHFVHGGIVDSTDDLYRLPDGEIRHGYSGELMLHDGKYDSSNFLNGKVIGEFVCDKIVMSTPGYKDHVAAYWELLDGSCLTADELMDYGQWKFLYGWHISDLVIYDKPKDLSEFTGLRKTKFGYEPVLITRPPQSWCYVEELPGGAE